MTNSFNVVLRQSAKLTGPMPDGDYTQEFLDEGTTLSTTEDSVLKVSRPVPVTKAWVEDGVLYMEAEAVMEWSQHD